MKTLSDMLAKLPPKRREAVEARTQALIAEEWDRIYFRSGETITCENGHEIADTIASASQYDVSRSAMFANWRNVEYAPKPGDKPQRMRCTACGGRFCLSSGFSSLVLHIGRKWRTSHPETWGLNADEAETAWEAARRTISVGQEKSHEDRNFSAPATNEHERGY